MPQPITCQIAKSAHFVYRGEKFLITAPQCHPLIYGNTLHPHRLLDKLVTLRLNLETNVSAPRTETHKSCVQCLLRLNKFLFIGNINIEI